MAEWWLRPTTPIQSGQNPGFQAPYDLLPGDKEVRPLLTSSFLAQESIGSVCKTNPYV